MPISLGKGYRMTLRRSVERWSAPLPRLKVNDTNVSNCPCVSGTAIRLTRVIGFVEGLGFGDVSIHLNIFQAVHMPLRLLLHLQFEDFKLVLAILCVTEQL